MKVVEIVPGKGIGRVQLGALERDLPVDAAVANGVGTADHVHFSIRAGRVDDVWIDDLASFPYDLTFEGKVLARADSLDRLRTLFRECVQVHGIIGGTFYNCRGITIGCDQTGRPTQLRLKPR